MSENHQTLTIGESDRVVEPAPDNIALNAMLVLDFSGSILSTDREGLISATTAFIEVPKSM